MYPIPEILIFLTLMAWPLWLSYVKGRCDATHSQATTKYDAWHRWSRYGYLYPACAGPFLILIAASGGYAHSYHTWALLPGAALSLFAFRLGVWRGDPNTFYQWFGRTIDLRKDIIGDLSKFRRLARTALRWIKNIGIRIKTVIGR